MVEPTPDPETRARPKARPDLVFRRVGEEWVLFDPERQVVHVLNLSAALVWSLCMEGADEGQIRAELAEAYGIA